MAQIFVRERFCGPPNAGNGGYVCGRLAQFLPDGGVVVLRLPTPLNTPLDVRVAQDGGVELRAQGAGVVAAARPHDAPLRAPVPFVSFEEALAAERCTPYPAAEHVLPECFVCGPARGTGDGLRLSAGPVSGAAVPASIDQDKGEMFAVSWVPHERFGDDDGRVAEEFLWAALDCPTGYATREPSQLLGTMGARIIERPMVGERCVITARMIARDRRKMLSDGALYHANGALLAVANNTWITVPREVLHG